MFVKRIFLLFVVSLLSACGGGGGGSEAPASGGSGGTPEPAGNPITLDADNVSQAAEGFRQDIASPILFFETLRDIYTTPIPTFNLQNVSSTVNCDVSGTATVTSRSSGREVDQIYSQCVQSGGETLDGTLSLSFTNVNSSARTYTMTIVMDSLRVISGQDSATFSGTSTINARFDSSGRVYLDVNNKRTTTVSGFNQIIRSDDLNYSVNYPSVSDSDMVLTDLSGRIYLGETEYTSYNWSSGDQRVEMTGSGSEKGYIYLASDHYSLEFVNAAGDSSGIVVSGSDLEALDVFSVTNSAPVFRQSGRRLVAQNKAATLNFEDWLFDPNVDVLTLTYSVTSAPDSADYQFLNQKAFSTDFTADTLGEYQIRVRAEDPEGLSVEGNIILEFAVDTDNDGTIDLHDTDDDNDGVYDFDDDFPLDASESRDWDRDGTGDNADTDDDNDGIDDINDAFPFNQQESTDTDGDGRGNNSDSDDDNDGIDDVSDAFPLDASEHLDTDRDGVGNNADTDDDNDSIADVSDEFPNNPFCQSSSQGFDGRCIFEVISETDEISVDSNGVIYFLIKESKKIIRWSTTDAEFLAPIQLGSATPSDSMVEQMEFSESHNRLYFGYNTGAITYIDVSTTGSPESTFITLGQQIRGLASVGSYILAQDTSRGDTHHIISRTGTITDQKEFNYFSWVYAWNDINNRVYYFRDGISPNDILYEEIDQTSGLITDSGESPYHGDFKVSPPLIVSENGEFVLIGSGNIFNSSDLTWAGAIPGDISGAAWSTDDGLIVIRTVGSKTELERRDSNLVVQETLLFDGQAQTLLKTTNGYRILTDINGNTAIKAYTPSNDSDGDGVINTEDAFPTDPAASIDTDKDGYPDAWNPGYTQEDSNSNLSIDAYPNDSACYLSLQGDGKNCDYALTIPEFEPDSALADDSGTIYMLSSENNRVYRWSLNAGGYIAPIVVGNDSSINRVAPSLMAHSNDHNRLYFGYSNGDVSYVDLSATQPIEQPFVTIAESVDGIAAAGNHLLLQDDSGAWESHYIYSINGELRDKKEWNHYSVAYAWNNSLSRIYFFRDTSSPNDLQYEDIGPITGKITAEGDSPYHGDYAIKPPILISPNDQSVLLGSGDIFNAQTLNWEKSLGVQFDYGIWLDSGEVITLRTVDGATRLDHFDNNQNWSSEQNLDGTPVGIFADNGKIYVVTHNNGSINVTEYQRP
ncbi:MAG: hypothetical protein ACR2PT_24090 [Endozoicomonas sp.]